VLPLGTPLPSVNLVDAVTSARVDLAALAAGKRGALVMFMCNHCPYVVHIRRQLVAAAHEALDLGLAVVAINSNSVDSHPQDGPSYMAELARNERWRFPFLFDESQDVARAFRAACTPDLYVFDAAGKLVYHGQFDDSRPSSGKPVTGRDLRAAVAAVAAGTAPPPDQRASIGCSIKWK
jgi:thiol-disulfide isomerase/thioredoxin